MWLPRGQAEQESRSALTEVRLACPPCANPYHAIAVTVIDSSDGPKVREPAREAGDGRLVSGAADPDGGTLTLTQEKEVIRNG